MSSRRGLIVSVLVVMSAAGLSAPASAVADPTQLCKGFEECTAKQYGNDGYEAERGQRHWFQNAGANCTNYVAYRLINRNQHVAQPVGTVDGRGAAGWYDAALAAGVKVYDTPQLGDIAWWPAGYNKASATGHVAYVETLGAGGAVEVSEDNAGSGIGFRWRTLTKSGGFYPKKFLRFPSRPDGTPVGSVKVTWINSSTVQVVGAVRDPDDPDGTLPVTVTVGAAQQPVKMVTDFKFTLRFASSNFRGPVTTTVRAQNTKDGQDFVRTVKPTSVTASFVDSTIKKSQSPKLRFRLSDPAARGTVTVKRGTKTVTSFSVTGSTPRPYTRTLPRQSKGTTSIKVTFTPSNSFYLASSKTLRLTVR